MTFTETTSPPDNAGEDVSKPLRIRQIPQFEKQQQPNPVMRATACKRCPSTHWPADPECADIRVATKDERLATVFPCAWDRDYYCRGYCLYMGISNTDLATRGGIHDH